MSRTKCIVCGKEGRRVCSACKKQRTTITVANYPKGEPITSSTVWLRGDEQISYTG